MKEIRWSRNYDTYPKGALISQYMVMPHTPDIPPNQKSLSGGGHVWLLPLRQPTVDAGGHLRLGYWSGNDAIKGDLLTLVSASLAPTAGSGHDAGPGVATVFIAGSEDWDHAKGIVLTGTLTAPTAGTQPPAIGFSLQPPDPPPHPAGPIPGPQVLIFFVLSSNSPCWFWFWSQHIT